MVVHHHGRCFAQVFNPTIIPQPAKILDEVMTMAPHFRPRPSEETGLGLCDGEAQPSGYIGGFIWFHGVSYGGSPSHQVTQSLFQY